MATQTPPHHDNHNGAYAAAPNISISTNLHLNRHQQPDETLRTPHYEARAARAASLMHSPTSPNPNVRPLYHITSHRRRQATERWLQSRHYVLVEESDLLHG
jgi:uncharacterized protein (DUF3084 family)